MFKIIGTIKVYFSNAMMYVFMLNFIMLIVTTKQVYGIPIKAYVILPIALVAVMAIGFLDYIFVMKHQITHLNKMNDIKQQLDRIEKKLMKETV